MAHWHQVFETLVCVFLHLALFENNKNIFENLYGNVCKLLGDIDQQIKGWNVSLHDANIRMVYF